MGMSTIEIENLHKAFGKVQALDGVTFNVEKGEAFGFIGPNGAGKSTTIRTLLGMLRPDQGSARVFGCDAWKDAVEIHKRIAYVPGDVNLWGNLTGGEIVDLFIKMRSGKSGKISAEALKQKVYFGELFELDFKKKSRTYSKGNRQKVALVAAFSVEADLYIFDEPTSGLDPIMEKRFQDQVLEVKRQGKTVLLSSHILSEVDSLADRIGIIRKGQIIEAGTLDELKGHGNLEDLFLQAYGEEK